MEITSVNNEKIKNIVKLQQKKYRDLNNLYIIEGKHLVEEASKLNLVEEIYSTNNYPNSISVTNEVMKKISLLDTPSDVLAVVKKNTIKEINGNVLILDNIQDPGNLGTIIRSAVAFNIDTIIASPNTVDLYNPKVIRATEGMIFNVNYIEDDLEKRIKNLKDNSYIIYTTNVVKGTNLKDININKPYALIMGNEGNGVSKDIENLADEKINIIINNDCESLNVAVATSIILYEFNK